MSKANEYDLSKLPKWAQRRIQKLEHDVAYYKQEANLGLEEADAVLSPYMDAQPLGSQPTIRFFVGPDRRADWIDVSHRGDELTIQTDHFLLIQPGGGVNTAFLRRSDG